MKDTLRFDFAGKVMTGQQGEAYLAFDGLLRALSKLTPEELAEISVTVDDKAAAKTP